MTGETLAPPNGSIPLPRRLDGIDNCLDGHNRRIKSLEDWRLEARATQNATFATVKFLIGPSILGALGTVIGIVGLVTR